MMGWQKPFRGTQLNKTHPLARNLLLAYLLNENSGDIAYIQGVNRAGTIVNGTWDNGKLTFAGNGYVSLPNPNIPEIGTGPYTVFARIKTPASVPSVYPYLFGFDAYDPSWFITNGETPRMRVYDDGDYSSPSTYIFAANAVYDIAFVRDSSGILHFYYAKAGEGSHKETPRLGHIESVSIPTIIRLGSDTYGYTTGSVYFQLLYNREISLAEFDLIHREPYCMFTRALDIGAMLYTAPVVGGSIINQFQKANLGADLFNGSLI